MKFRILCLVFAVGGCAVLHRPLRAPKNDEATVLLITGGLPVPMNAIARHPWFAVRQAGEDEWLLYEVGSEGHTSDDPFDNSPYTSPVLHGIWRGKKAERAIACLEKHAPPWLENLDYVMYPGPNSNTFGDVMMRKCKLRASLPPTSVGKDWRGWIGAGRTSEGTGVQFETPIVGLKVGLKEGIEVHVFSLAFGVDLWPPAILVPFGKGRIGFADR